MRRRQPTWDEIDQHPAIKHFWREVPKFFEYTGKSKPSKYRARQTGGYSSAKEARRAQELELLEKAGKIRNLREQVPFVLIPEQYDHVNGKRVRAAKYVADFVYDELTVVSNVKRPTLNDPAEAKWVQRVEDCKGYRTPEYRLKAKLMLWVHGITIRET